MASCHWKLPHHCIRTPKTRLPFSDPRLDVFVPLIAVLNLPNDCGLVRFTTELGPLNQGRTGILCPSSRMVNRARSRICQLFESENSVHNSQPPDCVPIPSKPAVKAAG